MLTFEIKQFGNKESEMVENILIGMNFKMYNPGREEYVHMKLFYE